MKALLVLATILLCWLCNVTSVSRTAAFDESASATQTAANPGPANHLFYDAQRRQVVLLVSNQSGQEELWGWDDGQWQLIPGSGPAAREMSGAAYDTRRNSLVLYGGMGRGSEDRRGDTWEWDGKNWRQVTDTSVGTRDHHTLDYDEARAKTVLFGGQPLDRSWITDTWEWDGTKWAKFTMPSPGGRVHFPMVYDSKRKQVVLFGGLNQDFKLRNDTWAWDGKTWQKLSAEGPPPRYHHRMAFDSQAGVIVLFGGLGGGQPPATFDDTWIWDGQRWTEIKTAGPSKRSDNMMAYDAARGKTVLYGGGYWDGKASKKYDDTWEWDGKQWMQIK